MAKDIRIVTASADVSAVVDRGAEVDENIKNLTYEDKGLKAKLSEVAQSQFAEDESSIKLEGSKARAAVSSVEKTEVDPAAEKFTEVQKAVRAGLLEGIVTRKMSLVVPPGDVEKAAEALKTAGIQATVTESLSVKPDDLRNALKSESLSVEHTQAKTALKESVVTSVTYRIKYEKK